MSWWNLSPCSSLSSPKFWEEKFRWESRKCNFSDMLYFITWKHFNISLTISLYSTSQVCVPTKVSAHWLESIPCFFFIIAQSAVKVRILRKLWYLWANKYSLFYYSLTQSGNVFLKYVKACPFLSIASTKIFVNTSLMCRVWEIYVLRIH
jgi:hypothetical protein